MLLDTSCQAVTVGPPEKGFSTIHPMIGHSIVMNADEHCAGSLAVGDANPIVQFYEMIVVTSHHSVQASPAQFVANSPGRVKSEILFPKENWGPPTAHSAAILPTVTGVNDDRGKMSAARR